MSATCNTFCVLASAGRYGFTVAYQAQAFGLTVHKRFCLVLPFWKYAIGGRLIKTQRLIDNNFCTFAIKHDIDNWHKLKTSLKGGNQRKQMDQY